MPCAEYLHLLCPPGACPPCVPWFTPAHPQGPLECLAMPRHPLVAEEADGSEPGDFGWATDQSDHTTRSYRKFSHVSKFLHPSIFCKPHRRSAFVGGKYHSQKNKATTGIRFPKLVPVRRIKFLSDNLRENYPYIIRGPICFPMSIYLCRFLKDSIYRNKLLRKVSSSVQSMLALLSFFRELSTEHAHIGI